MSEKRLLLINGSPRRGGTSYSFARTLKKLTENVGNTAEIIHIIDYYDEKESFEELESKLQQSDIIAVVTPLYVDTLTYPNIWFFERLSDEYKTQLKGKRFFAIAQSGFLDIKLSEPLLNSCKFFAEETGMKWLGGLAHGGGAIINGEKVENLGRKGKKISMAFKLALENILQDKMVPSRSQELLTIKISKIFYPLLAAFMNHMTKRNLRKHNISFEEFTKKVYLD
ncbi:Multimeric flavodoxin WrbA [Natronincola peptidivorans]|uniref:Multimeric flavodoxin WrbA n=1 Tax=Natronincola peptidivorans TaxID=426128 RepID=A0A1I0CCB8_9FIRM|nr:NAD(P)H-dependent oxidoreductase [Natronincola peptidivorans]SET16918.1 Multimeric flavodoxin WrbA [Natronincola peptidivorans]